MGAPYEVNFSATDSESISRDVKFSDADGPFSVADLSFEYVLTGNGESIALSTGDGITTAADGYSITIALPVARRLREGLYEHGLRAIDADDFTQQVFYGTVSVSSGGGFSS